MALIAQTAGIRSGNPCRNDAAHDPLPCDSECFSSLALEEHLGHFDTLFQQQGKQIGRLDVVFLNVGSGSFCAAAENSRATAMCRLPPPPTMQFSVSANEKAGAQNFYQWRERAHSGHP